MTVVRRLMASGAGVAMFAAAGAAQCAGRCWTPQAGAQGSQGSGAQFTSVSTAIGNSSEVSFSGGAGSVTVNQSSGPTWSSSGFGGGRGAAPQSPPPAPLNVTTAPPVSVGVATGPVGTTGVATPVTVSGGSGGLVNVGPVASPTGGGGSVTAPVSTGSTAPVGAGTLGVGTGGVGTGGPIATAPITTGAVTTGVATTGAVASGLGATVLGATAPATAGVGTGTTGQIGGAAASAPVSAPALSGATPLQLCGACVGALTGGVGG